VRENETTLVTLLQTPPIHITFGIPEQSLAEVQQLSRQGPMEVEAEVGNGTTVKGRLDFIDNAVGAATGTIRLKASFANTHITSTRFQSFKFSKSPSLIIRPPTGHGRTRFFFLSIKIGLRLAA
jgi:hypothetical protein